MHTLPSREVTQFVGVAEFAAGHSVTRVVNRRRQACEERRIERLGEVGTIGSIEFRVHLGPARVFATCPQVGRDLVRVERMQFDGRRRGHRAPTLLGSPGSLLVFVRLARHDQPQWPLGEVERLIEAVDGGHPRARAHFVETVEDRHYLLIVQQDRDAGCFVPPARDDGAKARVVNRQTLLQPRPESVIDRVPRCHRHEHGNRITIVPLLDEIADGAQHEHCLAGTGTTQHNQPAGGHLLKDCRELVLDSGKLLRTKGPPARLHALMRPSAAG